MSEVIYDQAMPEAPGLEERVSASDEEAALDAQNQVYAGIAIGTDGLAKQGALSAKGQASIAQDAIQMDVFNDAMDDHSADNDESDSGSDNSDTDADRGKLLRALGYGLLAVTAVFTAAGIVTGGYFGIVALVKYIKGANANTAEDQDAPTPADQTIDIPHDTATSITLTATDTKQRSITFAHNQPSNGVVSGTGSAVTYTPNNGYVGSDSFTFTASAGGSTSDPGTISLTVKAKATTPTTPTANLQRLSTEANKPVAITLTGVPQNAGALSFVVTDNPSNGSLTGSAPNLTYTPTKDFEGADEFQFTVKEGSLTSTKNSVYITVLPAQDNSGEGDKWFKGINSPVGTEQELIDANKNLRGLNEQQFWSTYWQSIVKMNASTSMQARLSKYVASLMAVNRYYGADYQERVARKRELLGFAKAAATQMLIGYDATKKEALISSFKAAYDTVAALEYTGAGNPAVPRKQKLWVLSYALNQVAIQQGHPLTTVYNPYLSPNPNLTNDIRMEKMLDPLNGILFVFLKPSSLDIAHVRWSVDGATPTNVEPLYFPLRLDTRTLKDGPHALNVTVEFVQSSGKPNVTNSVQFDVDNTS